MIKPSRHDDWIITLTLSQRQAYRRELDEMYTRSIGIRWILRRYEVLKAKQRRDRKRFRLVGTDAHSERLKLQSSQKPVSITNEMNHRGRDHRGSQ